MDGLNQMILSKFKKPKWQHRDPEVRRTAIDDISDVETLKKLAIEDEDAHVRRSVVRKLNDMPLLQTLAQEDDDAEVRDSAQQRFKQLLSGQKDEAPPLAERLACLSQLTDHKLFEFLASKGQEIELRLAALQHVNREALLGDIASQDAASAVRLVAVEKLQQKSTLERVYKATRSSDKQVSRLAKEKLDRLIEQEERPAKVQTEAEAVSKRLEMLGKQKSPWPQEHTEYLQLQTRWQAIAAEVTAELAHRYQQAEQAFLTGWAAYEAEQTAAAAREQALIPLRTEKETLYNELDRLLTQLKAQARLTETEANEQGYHLQALAGQWAELAPLPEAEEKRWQQRFTQAQQAITQLLTQLQSTDEVVTTLDHLGQKAERLLAQEGVKPAKIKQLQADWAALTIPEPRLDVVQAQVDRLQTALAALEGRLEQHSAQRDEQVKVLKQVLQEMEAALEQGELHTALPLESKSQQLLSQITGLPSHRYKALEARVQKANGRIRELRSWESWGTYVERDQLCEMVEQLIDREDDDPEETARLIRQAQDQWKKLGSAGHSQAIWERFNKACNEAYKPCQVFFEQQAQQRQDNLAEKERVCAALEVFAQSVDWEQPDWKAIHNNVREFEKQWHNIGPTDRKTRKPLKKRFKQAIDLLEPKLEQERRRNQQFRERLIEKAAATHDIDAINEAIEQVKTLQAQWLVTVPSDRRIERQLWKNFRTTCDIVFERRKEQQEERRREQQTVIEEKTQLCEQVEALAKLTGEVLIQQAPAALKKLQSTWREGPPVPRRQGELLDKRFRTACEQVATLLRAASAAEVRSQLDLLQQKAALCHRLEQLEAAAKAEQLATLQAEWSALATLQDASDEALIQSRFEQATQADTVADAMVQKQRETLCIRMEILAGVESPPEAVEARMAYQVARLSEAMSGGVVNNQDKQTEAQEVERDWYLLPPTGTPQADRLEQRFAIATKAFYQLA